MKIDFQYATDFLGMSDPILSHTCMHLLCTEGEGSFVFNGYINRATVPILKGFLDDERLSLTQIADRMNFTSLSYFSRYCTKHLGQSPSEYRRSLQPKG